VLIFGNQRILWKIRLIYFLQSPAKFQRKIAAVIKTIEKKNVLECMNVSLLYIKHRYVSAIFVDTFRVVRTRIQAQLKYVGINLQLKNSYIFGVIHI
jgi:hypothetical protein